MDNQESLIKLDITEKRHLPDASKTPEDVDEAEQVAQLAFLNSPTGPLVSAARPPDAGPQASEAEPVAQLAFPGGPAGPRSFVLLSEYEEYAAGPVPNGPTGPLPSTPRLEDAESAATTSSAAPQPPPVDVMAQPAIPTETLAGVHQPGGPFAFPPPPLSASSIAARPGWQQFWKPEDPAVAQAGGPQAKPLLWKRVLTGTGKRLLNERLGNVLIFIPLTLTWLSIGLAALAYSQSIDAHPQLTYEPFLQMWAKGFPDLPTLSLFGGHLPLTFFGGYRWVSVEDTALIAVFFLAWLALIVGKTQRAAKARAEEPPAWMAGTLSSFDGGVKELNDILAALRGPVAEIEASVTKMGDSFTDFKVIAGQVNTSYQKLSGFAPRIDGKLQDLVDSQTQIVREVRASSSNLQEAANAMREVAEPFRLEGVDAIAQRAARQLGEIENLQQGIFRQQAKLYQQQTQLQEALEQQLTVLDQQMKMFRQMKPAQPQIDATQMLQALEQAGFLHKKYAVPAWLLKGWAQFRSTLSARP